MEMSIDEKSVLRWSHSEFGGLLGIARRDITPPVGIYARSWGAASHDQAEGIHRPMSATALVIRTSSKGDPLVFISMDIGWFRGRDEEWLIRGAILDRFGLQPENVMIGATHTHSGPSLFRDDHTKPGGELIESYLLQLQQAGLEIVGDALENPFSGTITWAKGSCDLAKNRDLRDPSPDADRVVTGFNPGAGADETVVVGRVCGEGGEIRGTLVNYACHPVTLAWENRLLSPDYVGAMREVVEQYSGNAPCLFMQGCSGELAPMEEYVGDCDIADKNGRTLGYAALSALEGMLPPALELVFDGVVESGAPLAVWRRGKRAVSTDLASVKTSALLPVKDDLPSLGEIEEQLSLSEDRVTKERLSRKRAQRISIGDVESIDAPIWVWLIGEALFVGQSNECYSDLQIDLRGRFPDRAVVVMNLVNGGRGYCPPAELFDYDVYQVWQTPMKRGCLEETIRISGDTAEQLLKNEL